MSLDCKKPPLCTPEEEVKEIYPPATPPFRVCVGDYELVWDGTRLTHERVRNTPDGTYDTTTLVDGCVVDYGYSGEAVYTPPYCNAAPEDCQDSEGGGSGNLAISPDINNTIRTTSTGLFARTYVEGVGNVSVQGTGTLNNPYQISMSSSNGGGGPVIGRNGIESEVSNSGVTYVGLTDLDIAGVYNGFTVDNYGRITAVSNALQNDIIPVEAGAGLTAVDDGEVVTISHTERPFNGTYLWGGQSVTLDTSGHVVDIARSTVVQGGTYEFGAFEVSVDNYGNIVGITQSSSVVSGPGSFTASDGSVVTYNASGRIVNVYNPSVARQATTPAGDIIEASYSEPVLVSDTPSPIIDTHRVLISTSGEGASLTAESYGGPTSIRLLSDTRFEVSLPNYITDESQVAINSSGGYIVDLFNHVAEVEIGKISGSKVITIAFRG